MFATSRVLSLSNNACDEARGVHREAAMTTMETRSIRYAVVGLGNIAQVAVLPAFEHASANSDVQSALHAGRSGKPASSPQYSAIRSARVTYAVHSGFADDLTWQGGSVSSS
jgi:hypothetical protein